MLRNEFVYLFIISLFMEDNLVGYAKYLPWGLEFEQ